MAANDHWVSDVFPVQFSIEEALSKKVGHEAKKAVPLYATEKLKDLYEETYARVLATKGSLSPDQDSSTEGESPDDNLLDGKESRDLKSNSVNKIAIKQTSCLWTKEELDVFRDGYFSLKKRAVHLLILLSDSKARNKELRKKCKNKDVIIMNQEHLLHEQKKQNLKLNATIAELRRDLKFSEKKLQQLLIIEAQSKDQNAFLKTELEEERMQNERTRVLCSNLDKSLRKHQKETKLDLVQQENVLKARHMHSMEKIEQENERLRAELEDERNTHKITKAALEQLRKHFANIQDCKMTENFLDVAEIANFK